jgi:hypothetical protein
MPCMRNATALYTMLGPQLEITVSQTALQTASTGLLDGLICCLGAFSQCRAKTLPACLTCMRMPKLLFVC